MTRAKSKTYDKEQYLFWYKNMLLIRRFEEKAGQLYGQQKIRGFCHLYIGQEACASGSVSALKEGDKWITAYRDHGLALALGISPNAVMAELYGKATGCSKGKGGSMHIFDKSKNLYGGHGIVGGQVPLGAGIAFAEKYKKTGNLCICFLGDGAVWQGAFHETLNMASKWKIPVIFVIENNGYAMGTSIERTSNINELYRMGHSYEIESASVNGMLVQDVHEKVSQAAKYVLEGKGAYLLEFRTYRYKGHSMSDPAKYRTKEEVAKYKDMDPIQNIKEILLSKKYLTDEQIKEINQDIKTQIKESVEFSEKSEYPSPEEIYKDVYEEPNYPFIEP